MILKKKDDDDGNNNNNNNKNNKNKVNHFWTDLHFIKHKFTKYIITSNYTILNFKIRNMIFFFFLQYYS